MDGDTILAGIAELQQNQPTPAPTQGAPTPDVPATPAIPQYEIEGLGTVSVDDIRSWRQGNMRQQDYTRKTQELARQREENAKAVQLYEYLQSNPHLVEAMRGTQQSTPTAPRNEVPFADSFNPMQQRLEQLERRLFEQQLDAQLNTLRSKYGEINDVELLQFANDNNIQDLEVAYRASRQVDEGALREQMRQEILRELQQTQSATQSIITPTPTSTQATGVMLSADEAKMASIFNMSPEDYAKWR